jgi:hypothetical protein
MDMIWTTYDVKLANISVTKTSEYLKGETKDLEWKGVQWNNTNGVVQKTTEISPHSVWYENHQGVIISIKENNRFFF